MDFYLNVARLGNNLLVRAVEDDVEVMHKVPYEPTLYLRSNNITGWKTLKGVDIEPRLFDSMSDANDFIKQMDGADTDVIHSVVDYPMNYIHEKYNQEILFNYNKIRSYILDIEVNTKGIGGKFPKPEEAKGEVNAITVYCSIRKRYYVFTYLLDKYEDIENPDNTVFVPCNDERDLLIKFVAFWQRNYPTIVSGWNSTNFDMPYLINRIMNVLGEDFTNRLSPWGRITARSGKNSFGQEQIEYNIFGIEFLDFLDLYKKYVPKSQESFKLGYIASLELDDTKIEYEGSLDNLAEDDPYLFIRYNKKDVSLVVRMEEKMQLIFLAVNIAYMMKTNYRDVLGTVKIWTSKVVFELLAEKKVVDKHHRAAQQDYGGGYVKEPLKGKYGWVVSYDFTSLYPSIIMGWNISPETKLLSHEIPPELQKYYRRDHVESFAVGAFPDEEILKKYDLCMTANGMFYRRDTEGIAPRLINAVFQNRKAKKKEMLIHKQFLDDIDAEIARRAA